MSSSISPKKQQTILHIGEIIGLPLKQATKLFFNDEIKIQDQCVNMISHSSAIAKNEIFQNPNKYFSTTNRRKTQKEESQQYFSNSKSPIRKLSPPKLSQDYIQRDRFHNGASIISPKNISSQYLNNVTNINNYSSNTTTTGYDSTKSQLKSKNISYSIQSIGMNEKSALYLELKGKIMKMKMAGNFYSILANVKERIDQSGGCCFDFIEEKDNNALKYALHLAYEEIDRLIQQKKNLKIGNKNRPEEEFPFGSLKELISDENGTHESQKYIEILQQEIQELKKEKEKREQLLQESKQKLDTIIQQVNSFQQLESEQLIALKQENNEFIDKIATLEDSNDLLKEEIQELKIEAAKQQTKIYNQINCEDKQIHYLLSQYMSKLKVKVISQQVLHQELMWFQDNIERLVHKFLQMSKYQISLNHIDFFKQEISMKYQRILQKIEHLSPNIEELQQEIHEIASDQIKYFKIESSSNLDENQFCQNSTEIKNLADYGHPYIKDIKN